MDNLSSVGKKQSAINDADDFWHLEEFRRKVSKIAYFLTLNPISEQQVMIWKGAKALD